ncbi:MAG: DUF6906 family protein [Peptostreptococcaceae bacterium]
MSITKQQKILDKLGLSMDTYAVVGQDYDSYKLRHKQTGRVNHIRY